MLKTKNKKPKSPRSNVQVLEVVELDGKRFWYSEVIGWVPHDEIEMAAEHFSVGTKITIQYSRETVKPSA